MTLLRDEVQKIILITGAQLDAKKAVPVNPKTAYNLQKLFGNQLRPSASH